MKPCVLIADSSHLLEDHLKNDLKSSEYHFVFAKDAKDCLEKIMTEKPQLIVVELLLPQMHGLQVLKIAKQNSKTGVFITDTLPLLQNFQSSIAQGADYYLPSPFTSSLLLERIAQFFSKSLPPSTFESTKSIATPKLGTQQPKEALQLPYLKFWGTRGSIPVCGQEYKVYGGNTPCLEIRTEDDLFIMDGGSGIRELGKDLMDSKYQRIHIFLSHTHLDHVSGLPFFEPLYDERFEIHIWSPIGYDKPTKEIYSELFSRPLFPVDRSDLKAKIVFHDLHDQDALVFNKTLIETTYACHTAATLCFKITIDKKTVGYITDNEFLMGYIGAIEDPIPPSLLAPYDRFLKFFNNCDYFIHEAQYFPDEYKGRIGWGHSSTSSAALLAKLINTKLWIVTHHDPSHTDVRLDLKKEEIRRSLETLGHSCCLTLGYDDYSLLIT